MAVEFYSEFKILIIPREHRVTEQKVAILWWWKKRAWGKNRAETHSAILLKFPYWFTGILLAMSEAFNGR